MINLSEFINFTIANERFSLLAELFSFCSKLYLLIALVVYGLKSKNTRPLTFLLITFLSVALLNDISWIILLVNRIIKPQMESYIITFIIRIAWSLFLTQYQALSFFMTYLIEKKVKIKFYNCTLIIFNLTIMLCFLYLAFFKFYIPSDSQETLTFERNLIRSAFFIVPFILVPTLCRTLKIIRLGTLPKILTYQSKVFITLLILPHLFLELIITKLSFLSFVTYFVPINSNILLSISTILCSYAIYYCSKSIMGLRFLNASNHVESVKKFNFINDFKDILEQLSCATTMKELSHLTKIFFKSAFDIGVTQTKLYVRKMDQEATENNVQNNANENIFIINRVENFLFAHNAESSNIGKLLQQTKIFIKDEIEFSNFYEENVERAEILKFLNEINADIFLPIYERQTITAFIIIENNARTHQLYNSTERDEMLVFTSYLSNIINILKNSNFEALIKKEKELEEELYQKHQEINQYKESLRSFLRTQAERKIGIVFYRTRKFIFANKAAQELIPIDINTHQGHPLTQAFQDIVRQVKEFKSSATIFTRDAQGTKLTLSAIPSFEQNNIIILIYYPEASDIIKSQLDLLKDPTKWDYLLYLETTQSGKLINQLIPGTGENLLNFKIDLLSIALSSKAILLEIPENDLLDTAEILHLISLRQNFQMIKLTTEEKNNEIAIKLFGINPLIQISPKKEQSLLEKLNNLGTLFIQNVHLLGSETQNYLAEFLTYGYFYRFKSEQKIFSNVKIICSSNKNLQALVTEGKFCKSLFNELKKAYLIMPAIATLPDHEITDLAQGFTEQAIKMPSFKNLLNLSEKERNKILEQKPVSLRELKEKIHQILSTKSIKQNIEEKISINPAYYITDPEIAQAVKLGKNALKNEKIMTMLWNKFSNQTQIANLLGVNRSSVNRRCKEYNLS